MKRLLPVVMGFALLLLSSTEGWSADYQDGKDAYNRGDYATALRVFKSLAEQGDGEGQNGLGVLYQWGKGVPQNHQTAVKWYRLSAEQGYAKTQNNLGFMYAKGQGVIQDDVYAHMWYNIAASQGYKDASGNRDIIAERMTRSQLAKAQQLARNFVPKKNNPVVITKKKPKPLPKSGTSGSGFFISKLGHVITNQHVVSDCGKVTIGDNSKKQVTATVMETDRRNDLALLRISNMQMASVETKSLIRKLGIKVVPLATDGLMRSEDVELGEDVLVAGYPYGALFSDNIKVNKGIVSGLRGMGDDTGQFQIDASVQPGNSGGPIYDENGNIVGVVVAQLNKRKFEKIVGSIPENVNFGIKASTVRQFLNASGLLTKWSKRSKSMSTRELAKIAKSQTVMVVCHQ
jgi:S1-C subfamily serine protease